MAACGHSEVIHNTKCKLHKTLTCAVEQYCWYSRTLSWNESKLSIFCIGEKRKGTNIKMVPWIFLQLMPTSCKTALQHSRLQVANWFSGADNITSVSAHVFTTGAKSLLAATSAAMEQHTTIMAWQADAKNCPQTCLNKCIRASITSGQCPPIGCT